MFYILSIKWSQAQQLLLWWRPNDAGYTMFLESAGKYTKEQVEAKPGYYNNGESTRAVPVEAVEGLANMAVYCDRRGEVMEAALPIKDSK